MSPVILILWPASVLFTAVLSFRIGYWWKTTETQGRHAVGNVPNQEPWYSGDISDESALGSKKVATRWWSEDDTEVIPVLDDFDRRCANRDNDY
ncbi:hypothetical protein [Nocardia cyriacigeorgica]|uniref:hypothetical protein n=1 Tax=Nocardia cyriacigeorgica TaxID=135487 RepID=UPI002456BD92|nr:hypothetical protein [Nocardia cyriacigeorgica]